MQTMQTPLAEQPVVPQSKRKRGDAAEPQQAPAGAEIAAPPKRRPYRPFSKEESDALLVGIERYGAGSWTKIQSDPSFPFMTTQRRPLDLKDKWRVLSRGNKGGELANRAVKAKTKKVSRPAARQTQHSGVPAVRAPVQASILPSYTWRQLEALSRAELVALVFAWQQQRASRQPGGVPSGPLPPPLQPPPHMLDGTGRGAGAHHHAPGIAHADHGGVAIPGEEATVICTPPPRSVNW
jgi:hypothetical protein